jgi:hypothetical protein
METSTASASLQLVALHAVGPGLVALWVVAVASHPAILRAQREGILIKVKPGPCASLSGHGVAVAKSACL